MVAAEGTEVVVVAEEAPGVAVTSEVAGEVAGAWARTEEATGAGAGEAKREACCELTAD